MSPSPEAQSSFSTSPSLAIPSLFVLQTPRQIPYTRQPLRTIGPTLHRPQKLVELPHGQIQTLPQPRLERQLPLRPRQRAAFAPDPGVAVRRIRPRRRHLEQPDERRVRVGAGVEAVGGDEGGEEGGGRVWGARVDGAEDGGGGGVGGEGGGPDGDVVLEGVDAVGAVPPLRCVGGRGGGGGGRGVGVGVGVGGVGGRGRGAQGRAQGQGGAVVLLARLGGGGGGVGQGGAVWARLAVDGAEEAGGPELVRGAELGGGQVPAGEVGSFLQLGVAVGGRGVVAGEVGARGDVGGHVGVGGDVEVGGHDDGDAVCEGVGEEGDEGGEREKVQGHRVQSAWVERGRGRGLIQRRAFAAREDLVGGEGVYISSDGSRNGVRASVGNVVR